MEFLKDRRTWLLLAGGLAALAIGIAGAMFLRSGHQPSDAPPASHGGLVVETGRADDTAVDPARPIRCFVAGQFVGELTLAACAQRNGVATGALDVGIDPSGALAGGNGAGPEFAPLPPPPAQPLPAAPTPVAAPPAADQPVAATPAAAGAQACWRYAGGWRRQPNDASLNDCVQALYAGRCEHAGGATYGRWGEQTLRLVPGRVETSSDNRNFHTLVEQAENCSLPPLS